VSRPPAQLDTARARKLLLGMFTRVQLDNIADDAGVTNPTFMNRPDLETYLIANWPIHAMTTRVARLLAHASGETPS
jgi:hypothetical protein